MKDSDIAYRCGANVLSYGELRRRSAKAAGFFALSGFTRVMIYGKREPDIFAAITGCIKSRTEYAFCDASIPDARLNAIIGQFNPQALVCGGTPPKKCSVPVIPFDNIVFAKLPSRVQSCNCSENVYTVFTSGTSGSPKGISISAENYRSFYRWFSSVPAIKETKPAVVLNQASFSFDLSVAAISLCIYTNASMCTLSPDAASDFKRLFVELKSSAAELAVITPSFAELCLCDKSFGRKIMPELKVVFFCGEPLKPTTARKLFERFDGLRIVNAYGPSESCCAVCATEITPDDAGNDILPAGDISSAAVEIIIAEGNKRVADGTCGEIALRGQSVARGYISGEKGGFRCFEKKRCFFTGDIGCIIGGKLYINGRIDNQVKVAGYRIELEDIERNLCVIKGVDNAAAALCGLGERKVVCAFAVTERDTCVISAELAKLLPSYMLPKKIFAVKKLPVTENGKCDRRRLAELYGQKSADGFGHP